ncbi:protein REGULATOR OF FATTY ACID COMPOSITION 3, chloroplastic-like isoform X2 [Mercurialis annua]|uniref:protein REGULATOR OF FATTY ACID COMPOSITION 3, chloroplastic-like isoform X2 n=1 Tax=Mercurialis annua TaxID=3986 RepID=UPI0024AE29A1|nr:protein REGULATOR OF FATTY ACID COMPOSITION 3, chloroplastic-like isoform X2 [Mercurialis annua]
METLLQTTSTYPNPNRKHSNIGTSFSLNKNSNTLTFINAYTCPLPFTCTKLPLGFHSRKSIIVGARKKKEDKHSFVSKEDEATGPFPEAVLLKEKKVLEDGQLLPEFADDEEEKLYEFLNLEMESQLKLELNYVREKKGRIWRMNDWGMRRLAYKIQKATHAHYILMNFEIEAKWINDFKSMLDKDERVIRHLVIKRDEAITEDCPPPPEFQSLRAGFDDDDDDEDDEDDEDGDDLADEEDYDDDGEMDGDGDEIEDGIIFVDADENDDDDSMEWNGKQNQIREKVGR